MTVNFVEKLWGHERWLHNDDLLCMKELTLRHGFMSSLHMHKIKREVFLVTFGSVWLEYDGQTYPMWEGESIYIEPGKYHRFRALSDRATVVESSTRHDDADVYRKEDSRKI